MLQHYIPKFILEGFVDEKAPGNRGVWTYHARYKSWQKRSTKKTASVDDLYSFIEPEGTREDGVEEMLHKFETPMALLLKKDIGARRRIGSQPHRDDLFITFCSLLLARNPATVDYAKATLVREAKEWLTEITESSEAFQNFRNEYSKGLGVEFPNVVDFRRLRDGFRISATQAAGLGLALMSSRVFADRLTTMDVDFLFAPAGGLQFITADVPYLIIGMPEDRTVFDQVVVPLSAQITALFNASENPEYQYVDATDAQVRSINRAMLMAAREMIISKTPDVFPREVMDEWATATPEGRVELVKELALRPGA
jgi:hypothetical protein